MKIAIEANIGAGKSTLMKNLFEKDRVTIFQEPVSDWQFLSKFYEDPSRWGLTFNLEVLMTFQQWKDITFNALIERSPLSCRYVFTQLQYDNQQITADELALFDKLFNNMAWFPDVIIYIDTSPSMCFERMQKRGRECESCVPLEYLQSVDEKYQVMLSIAKNNNVKVYVVDGSQDQESVYNDVKALLQQLKYK